ncbi:butyrophilin-like protein 1 [Astatotilapia calliptera]|uniref:butyrophilin-like protein 1 n=1 Tax=Astatotilapia calliptera TaxID=8154 RepID=UPI000E4078AA|nr:butyrophilin-like protein 1 [Astatotilapia calliptera]
MDASDMTVEWSRPDLDLRLVHVWPERPELQNPSYKGRTSLFINEMKHGELSLKISRVKPSDEGKYRCFVPDLRKDSNVQLVVSAVSSPVISFAGLNKTISGVVLQCECAGWYPEPELLWLDAEGNLLSAGPTETLRGPDDLYTVSSRVTVEKRHSNNITCRVQQRNTNQRRETHIHVPDDFFLVSPSGPPSRPISNPNVTVASAVSVAVVLLLIGAVFFVWKWRRGKFKKKKSEEDGAEQARKKNTISPKNSGMQVVEEQGKPLMTGREEEDNVGNSEEKNFKSERETQQDVHETETEQGRDTESPQERRINASTVNDKETLIKMEHQTQDMTGSDEKGDVNNSGKKKRQKKMVMKKPKRNRAKKWTLTVDVLQHHNRMNPCNGPKISRCCQFKQNHKNVGKKTMKI